MVSIAAIRSCRPHFRANHRCSGRNMTTSKQCQEQRQQEAGHHLEEQPADHQQNDDQHHERDDSRHGRSSRAMRSRKRRYGTSFFSTRPAAPKWALIPGPASQFFACVALLQVRIPERGGTLGDQSLKHRVVRAVCRADVARIRHVVGAVECNQILIGGRDVVERQPALVGLGRADDAVVGRARDVQTRQRNVAVTPPTRALARAEPANSSPPRPSPADRGTPFAPATPRRQGPTRFASRNRGRPLRCASCRVGRRATSRRGPSVRAGR